MAVMKQYAMSFALLLALVVIAHSCASLPAGKEGWSTATQQWSQEKLPISNPESTFYYSENKSIYVSNVAGAPTAKDGKGWIDVLDRQGKMIRAQWVKGLNAPKGMRVVRGLLWVSDIDRVLAIDLSSGNIVKKISVKNAKFLNDVAGDAQGNVYVSDMTANQIIQINLEDKVSIFAEGPELASPNGLLDGGDVLYVAAWGKGMKADWSVTVPGHIYEIQYKSKVRRDLSSPIGNLDGLELDGYGGFFVSDWMSGKVYSVNIHGIAKVIYQTDQGAADIGLLSEQEILLPEMNKNRITLLKVTQ